MFTYVVHLMAMGGTNDGKPWYKTWQRWYKVVAVVSPEVASEKYLARLQEIDVQIAKVQKQAQKETQMNQRLPLHMKIHELKQEKEQLIKELK